MRKCFIFLLFYISKTDVNRFSLIFLYYWYHVTSTGNSLSRTAGPLSAITVLERVDYITLFTTYVFPIKVMLQRTIRNDDF